MTRDEALQQAKILKALITVKETSIILNTFIKTFIANSINKKGKIKVGNIIIPNNYFLMGNFNINGTLSGRMSSSKPNLQNLPSTGTKYAKLIKGCFRAPPGWLMVGADFSSLEDKISALTTRDPNKLAVYEEGYDGPKL